MIEASHLQKKFDGRGIAGLSDISFVVPKGKVAAVMGPNGSGKSSLLNSLLGIITLDSGKFKLSGKVKFFHTKDVIFDGTVQDYLISMVDSEVDPDKKIQLSRDFAQIFEFTSQLKQKMTKLSTGQKQKVLISGELINSPDVILMDEPFTHLDPFTRKEILLTLFSYLRNKELTCLWVTHEISEATRFSDFLGVIQHGQLEQWGTPTELMFTPKNLFVAKFIGFENFIAVKSLGKSWSTPWGEMNFNYPHTKPDAVMVIPSYTWEVDTESNFKVTVTEVFPDNFGWTHYLKKDEQQFVLWASEKLGSVNAQLLIKPKSNQAFLIAL